MKTMIRAAAMTVIILSAGVLAKAQGDPAARPAGSWDARLYNIRGKVFIQPAGGGKKWIPVTRGMPLMQGDRIGTGKNSKVDVSLDDGGVATVNESSAVLLKSLRRKDASFTLNVGKLLLKLPGLKKRLESFQVRTPAAVAAVRGTEFAVSYDTITAESEVNVFDEGQVHVTSLDEDGDPVGDGVLLGPRHEVRVKRDMETLKPAETKDPKARNSEFSETRRGYSELKGSYRPLKEQERGEQRKDAIGAGEGTDTISSGGKGPQKAGEAQENAAGNEQGGRNGPNASAQAAGDKAGRTADGKEGGAAGAKQGARAGDEASLAGKKQDDDTDTGRSLNNRRAKNKRRGGDDDGRKKGFGKGGAGDEGSGRRKAGGGDSGNTKMAGSTDNSAGDKTATLDKFANTPGSNKKVEAVASKLEDRLASTGNSDLIGKDELRALIKKEMIDSPSEAVLNQRLSTVLASRLEASQNAGTLQTGSQLQLQNGSQLQNSNFTPMTPINTSATGTKITAPATTTTKKKLVIQ